MSSDARLTVASSIIGAVRHLSREARLGLVLASLVCFAVLIALGLKLHDVRGPVRLNERADHLVFGHLFGVSVVPHWAARSYQELGQPVPFAILIAAIVVGLLWRRDLADAAVGALGVPIAVLLADAVAKPAFDRIGGSAVSQFPSGHTTAMTAVGVLLVLVAYRRWGTRGVVVSLPVAAWVSGSMILSVIRLQQHVLTDAIGGVLLGVATVTAVAAAVSAVAESVPSDRRRAGRFGAGWVSALARETGEPGLGPLSSAAAPPPVPGPASAGAAGPDRASDGPHRPL